MAVVIPPPTERVVPHDYLREPWYRALDDMTRAINDTATSLADTTASIDDYIAAPVLPIYAVVDLPSAATVGQVVYVSDESGGAVLAFSDGVDWRRVTDRAIVT